LETIISETKALKENEGAKAKELIFYKQKYDEVLKQQKDYI
jgi:hypothetical protein